MVDRITKSLRKLSGKEEKAVVGLLQKIKAGHIEDLDIKKLKGHQDIYRVRKGHLRVIYRVSANHHISVLALERRSDTTYHKF